MEQSYILYQAMAKKDSWHKPHDELGEQCLGRKCSALVGITEPEEAMFRQRVRSVASVYSRALPGVLEFQKKAQNILLG